MEQDPGAVAHDSDAPAPAGRVVEQVPRNLVAALDIGGTKIAAGLVDERGGVGERVVIPTPSGRPGEILLGAVNDALTQLVRSVLWPRVGALGIASAGPVNAAEGTVSPVNIPGWRDFPLVRGVRQVVGRLPVTLVGDGVAMAAAEQAAGAARGYRRALGVVVSTGVGGGLVLDGRPFSGATGNAGHIGHICVELSGPRCACGGHGCVETFASGPAIVRYALSGGWVPEPGAVPTAEAVARAAVSGDPAARAAFERAGQAVGAAIAAAAALVEIDVAVVGGGVAGAGELLLAPVRKSLEHYARLSFTSGVPVFAAEIGADGGLVGAAAACRTEWSPHC